MNSRFVPLGCLLLLALCPRGAQAEKRVAQVNRYALLIGVDDYSSPLRKLKFCQSDMRELGARLEAAGFAAENVRCLSDRADQPHLLPTKANIEAALRERLQSADEDDIVVVAFSGHGLRLEGKNYLCPQDAGLSAQESLLPVEEVYSQLKKCRAAQKLLIVDACRHEPLEGGFIGGRLADDWAVQLQTPPPGVLVFSSCEQGQFSAEDDALGHGDFMHHLIQGLSGAADAKDRNGRISPDELYSYVYDQAARRPVKKGELAGRFDLAILPDRRLKQAETLLQGGQHEQAIKAFTQIVDDAAASDELRREARKSRGVAYQGKSENKLALADFRASGVPGIKLKVKTAADLKVGSGKGTDQAKGVVKQNQTVLVTQINGDWFWVASVDGNDVLKGYVTSAAFREPPPSPAPAAPPPTKPQPQSPYDWRKQWGGHKGGGHHGWGGGWGGGMQGRGRW